MFRRGHEPHGQLRAQLIDGQSSMSSILQKDNFLRDQSGMKKQLSTLQQLVRVPPVQSPSNDEDDIVNHVRIPVRRANKSA